MSSLTLSVSVWEKLVGGKIRSGNPLVMMTGALREKFPNLRPISVHTFRVVPTRLPFCGRITLASQHLQVFRSARKLVASGRRQD